MVDSRFRGGCGCGVLRYHLAHPPLFVHACHCLACQKRSGSAFGITTIILASELIVDTGGYDAAAVSPRTTAFRCQACGDVIQRVSNAYPASALLNTGTLDDPRELTIGAHIWTRRKHGWLNLPAGVPQFVEGYERTEAWPSASLQRLQRELERIG